MHYRAILPHFGLCSGHSAVVSLKGEVVFSSFYRLFYYYQVVYIGDEALAQSKQPPVKGVKTRMELIASF